MLVRAAVHKKAFAQSERARVRARVVQGVTPGGARETPTFNQPGRARVSDGLSVTR